MAPSIVKTTAIQTVPVSKINEGFNKEFFVGLEEAYGHQDEIKGTVKQPPASFPHYLPVWDNETARCVSLDL
jgi:sulfonate dioxygenase